MLLNAKADEEPIDLIEFLDEVIKYPNIFMIEKESYYYVELLAKLLKNYAETDNEITYKNLQDLIEKYKDEINKEIQNKEIIQNIMATIKNTTQSYLAQIDLSTKQHENEIMPLLLAENIINIERDFYFFIYEIQLQKSPQKYYVVIF